MTDTQKYPFLKGRIRCGICNSTSGWHHELCSMRDRDAEFMQSSPEVQNEKLERLAFAFPDIFKYK